MNIKRSRFSPFRILVAMSLFLGFCLPLFAQDAREWTKKGRDALRTNDVAGAKECLWKAMQLDKTWAEPVFLAADVFKRENKPAERKKALKKAYELESDNPTYREAYSEALKDDLKTIPKSDRAKLLAARKEILSVNPADFGTGVAQMKDMYNAKEYDDVITTGIQLLKKNEALLPDYAQQGLGDVFFILSKAEYAKKDLKNAKDHVERATRYPLEDADDAKALAASMRNATKKSSEDSIAEGDGHAKAGRVVEARAAYERALVLDPGNDAIKEKIDGIETKGQAKVVLAEARAFIAEEKWLQARDKLEEVLGLQPENQEAQQLLKKAEAFERGVAKKLGLTDKLPRTPEEREALCQGLLTSAKRFNDVGNSGQAKVAYEQALALIEVDAKLEKFRGQIQQNLEKIGSSDSLAENWKKAKECYKNGEFEESLKLLKTLPKKFDIDLESYLAYCYWKIGDYEQAKTHGLLQFDTQPENNRARFVVGNILLKDGKIESAYKLFQAIKEADPDYPGIDDCLYKSGAFSYGKALLPPITLLILLYIAYLIYNYLPEYKKNSSIRNAASLLKREFARECVEELTAVKKLPNLSVDDGYVVSRLLAQAYLKTGNYERAIGECKHLLTENPQDVEAMRWLGFSFLGKRLLTPESIQVLTTLYKTESKNKALTQLLGQHYLTQKNLSPEGVDILERWFEVEPTNPDMLRQLGRHYLMKGRMDTIALQVFDAMTNRAKPEPDFILGVAKLHLKAKKYQECLTACEKVLSIDINSELVHPVLRECYHQMGKIEDLVNIYRTYLNDNPYNVAFQKGLKEAQKFTERMSGAQAPQAGPPQPGAVSRPGSRAEGPGQPQAPAEAIPDQAGEPSATGNEILCAHCKKANSRTDYYCQHCGKPMG